MTDIQSDVPDILLLHGFMLDPRLWDEVRDGLSKIGRLHFADLSQDDSIEAMAHRVLETAPKEFILIGFSLGGYVSQHIHRFAPERVKAIALINTSTHLQSQAEIARIQSQIDVAKKSPFKGLTKRALQLSVAPDRANDEALLDRLQAMALKNGKDVFIRQLTALRDDGWAEMYSILCPALVITSRHDQMRSVAESEEMANMIPNAKLVVLDKPGHMTPLESPDEVLRALTTWIYKNASVLL